MHGRIECVKTFGEYCYLLKPTRAFKKVTLLSVWGLIIKIIVNRFVKHAWLLPAKNHPFQQQMKHRETTRIS